LLIEETGHIANYEAGGPAILSGVSCRKIRGSRGLLSVDLLQAAHRAENQHFSPTRLLCLENTANLGGGVTYSLDQLREIREWADESGILVHMDGARLFNACVVRGYSPAEVADCCDSVSICFSKGLGCPMGSILVGSHDTIQRARRARKIFGGALRQAGFAAAACLYALDHHVDRLSIDHENARLFADSIAKIPGVIVDPDSVETNLVFFEIDADIATAEQVSRALGEQGVRIYALKPQLLRACTHHDVDREGILRAASILKGVMLSGAVAAVAPTLAGVYGSR